MRFAFIKDHRDVWPVRLQCRVLEVSHGGFYAWCSRPASKRQKLRDQLVEAIRAAHVECRGVYGSPRITRELKARQGVSASENTIARVMSSAGITACVRRRFVPRTTDSRHGNPVASNLLNREFTAEAPNRKWVCDITYIWTKEQGWLYLAGVMDLYSRRIVGWSMAGHLKTQLVEDALTMAISTRRPGPGLVHHSDRGVQYTSESYRQLLSVHGMECSMSGRGNCYDNAAKESLWSTIKREAVPAEGYETHAHARASLFEYIEVFYNRQRRHSALGYVSPAAFEANQN